jgi:predicted outer membrane protein
MNLRRWIPVLLGPILLALAGGCAGRAPAPTAATAPPAAVAAQGALPDDAQGMALFLAANRSAIERADVGVERATGADARALAATLAQDHRDFAARLGDLASRLAIVPVETAESRQVRADEEETLARLREAPAETFDAGWREAALAAEERLRQRLDAVLVPAARDPEYRAALLEIRPRVARHLAAFGRAPAPAP